MQSDNSNSAFELTLNNILSRPWQPVTFAEPIPIDALPTPALLVNEGLLDANIAKMAQHLGQQNLGFRPHSKTHKCPVIAKKQLAAGAVGICTAKLGEAYAMVTAGIEDVLITSPLATPQKLAAVARLAEQASGLALVVDSVGTLELLQAALAPGVSLNIVADVDVAMGRTGTRDTNTLLRIAELASNASNLNFFGIQHYAGQVMHIEGFAARRAASLELWAQVTERVAALTAAGFAPGIVSGGGTGTYNIDSEVKVITDLQVGSYVFMDQEYRLVGGRQSEVFDDFAVSLTLAAAGISEPMAGRAFTVDAGYKSLASDTVPPEPIDLPGARFRFGGDEHGIVLLPKPGSGVESIAANQLVGQVHQFVTPHCDPTVNLHDFYYVHDGQAAYAAWPITARGAAW